VKALRLYEQLGLIEPIRNAAGWRSYGGAAMTRGAEIAALRALGMSLAQIGQVLCSQSEGLEPALAAHQQGAVVIALEATATSCLVIDMIEQGLDKDTQEALISYLRLRPCDAAPLFLMTRSTAILDLTLVGRDEAIIFCPANHSPPTLVEAYPGAPGYESVASCLASPAVRARTAGMVA
jgi:DNA-binding transcriptional MerR regulator